MYKVIFFLFFPVFLVQHFNGPIINDCGHFVYHLLLPSKLYRLNLNLANRLDKGDWVNLKRQQWETVQASICILMLLLPQLLLMPVFFSFSHIYRVLSGSNMCVARKRQQTKRANGCMLSYTGCLTFFCCCESAQLSVTVASLPLVLLWFL